MKWNRELVPPSAVPFNFFVILFFPLLSGLCCASDIPCIVPIHQIGQSGTAYSRRRERVWVLFTANRVSWFSLLFFLIFHRGEPATYGSLHYLNPSVLIRYLFPSFNLLRLFFKNRIAGQNFLLRMATALQESAQQLLKKKCKFSVQL